MAIPTFPAYAILTDEGYSEWRDFGTLRTDMPGMPSQRSRWSHAIVTREVTVLVRSNEDKVQFDEFLLGALRLGCGWFRFRDPVDRVEKLGRLLDGRVQWVALGNVWTGRCSIESIG